MFLFRLDTLIKLFPLMVLFADINECGNSSSHNCDEHASCSNTDGSFECSCNVGYSGDGTTCTSKYISDI